MNKTICIDYDGTYTDFTEELSILIDLFKKKGNKVIICTMRYNHEEDSGLKFLHEELGLDVYYTGRKAKMEFLQAFNIIPDLWIDDNPHWILHPAG